jgi:hypothetical protein
VVRWLDRGRGPSAEQVRYDSFRKSIAVGWRPRTFADHRLALRSSFVHLINRWFLGEITLFGLGLSGAITTLGSILLTVAPSSHRTDYDTVAPLWISVVLTAGIVGLAIEGTRSPRAIKPSFAIIAALPLAVSCLAASWLTRSAVPPDAILRVAMFVGGLGALASGLGVVLSNAGWVRRGLRAFGVAAVGIAISDGWWVGLFALDRDLISAFGCLASSLGTLLMVRALLGARPSVARRA